MIKGGSLTAATFLLFSLHYILKDHQWDDIFLNGLPNSLSGCFEILQLG